MSIHPGDLIINPQLGARYMRKDDVVRDIVTVRRRQDETIDRLGLKPPPSIPRLRQANDVRSEFSELFQDLELPQPQPRADGNPTGERLDHLRQLQRHCPRWAKADLGRLAQADARGFENAANDIVRDAKAVAADPHQGSFRRPGALRPIVRTDASGHKTTQWCGNPDSWMNRFKDPLIRCLNAIGDGRGNWYPGPPT
jgi:hypothetical protein